MKLKKFLILLSFSLVFTNIACETQDRASQEKVSAVEDVPAPEEDFDFDLDNLNTSDVNALLKEVEKLEELPHETTISQDLALVKAFFEMKLKNGWDEFKTEPLIHTVALAAIITSIVCSIYCIKKLRSCSTPAK